MLTQVKLSRVDWYRAFFFHSLYWRQIEEDFFFFFVHGSYFFTEKKNNTFSSFENKKATRCCIIKPQLQPLLQPWDARLHVTEPLTALSSSLLVARVCACAPSLSVKPQRDAIPVVLRPTLLFSPSSRSRLFPTTSLLLGPRGQRERWTIDTAAKNTVSLNRPAKNRAGDTTVRQRRAGRCDGGGGGSTGCANWAACTHSVAVNETRGHLLLFPLHFGIRVCKQAAPVKGSVCEI